VADSVLPFKIKSRTQKRIENTLGIIAGAMAGRFMRVRSEKLDTYDKYLHSKQYDHLVPWEQQSDDPEDFIPIRKRRPLVIFGLPKRLVDTVAAKLVGQNVFPQLKVEDDPDSNEFLRLVLRAAKLPSRVMAAVKGMLANGSSFARFYVVAGSTIRIETVNSNHCYPEFGPAGELLSVEVRYVYADPIETDEKGKPVEKWVRYILGPQVDIEFDNPKYIANQPPVFTEVGRVAHNLGFVQGTWFRTGESRHSPDGPSLYADALAFFDSINYSLSQADQAVAYAHEPQLGISGMDVDEIDKIIKSSTKAWNLGRDGSANFIEANLGGVERGIELRDKMSQAIQNTTRVLLLDPEKIVGSAQSAKAMEVLHGPLVELVEELRGSVEDSIVELVNKIAATILILEQQGANEIIEIPASFKPEAFAVVASWPPIFPMTMADLQQKVSVANIAATASLVSRETLTGWLARDFGIEDVEAEVAKVAAQPVINPFGGF